MRFDNFEAWIESEGETIKEYVVETNGNEITCWIPSETGKSIAIAVKDHSQMFLTRWKTYFDGVQLGHRTLRMGRPEGKVTDLENPDGLRCPILFCAIPLTDDDALENKVNKDLGTVKIEVFRAKEERSSKRNHTSSRSGRPSVARQSSTKNVLEVKTVHEKSKKLASHCITMGDPRPGSSKSERGGGLYTVRCLDTKPRVTFTFKYRKKDILIANDIMTKPEPAEDKKNSSTNQLMSSSKRTMKGLLRTEIEIIELSDDEPPVVVKPEKKRVKREAAEPVIIDLT